MSSKACTGKADAAKANQNNTTHAPYSAPESADTSAVRTETEGKLWEALCANPNSTAADLSADAGIGRSTAAKILARWANDGRVSRTPGTAADGRRAADLWSISHLDTPPITSEASETEHAADTDENSATPAPVTSTDTDTDETNAGGEVTLNAGTDTAKSPADNNDSSDDGQHKIRRLAPGGLRGLVEDWLRDHAGEEFSPSAIGKALGRSSGAVANALDKLVTDGYATQTQDRPKRFIAKITSEPVAQN